MANNAAQMCQILQDLMAKLHRQGTLTTKIAINTPEVFKGDSKKLKEFLQLCELYFWAGSYWNNQKIMFAFSYIDHGMEKQYPD